MRKMKDSGVEWIGMIPEEWECVQLGSLFVVRNDKVSDVEYQPLSVTKQGILPQLENVAKTDANDNRKLVLANDFVINSRSDRKQSCGVSTLNGSVSLINVVLKVRNEKNLYVNYLNYLMKNHGFAEEFYRWGHGIVADLWTTRWQEMKNILLPLPPLSEQEAIARYLDDRCKKVDDLIGNVQGQIEKLQGYKQSLISELVTKGLDRNVALKDSGVEWIGEIPEGWECVQLGSLFFEHRHKNISMQCNNLLSLSYGNIIRKNINTADGLLPESFEGYNVINKGDIVLRLTDLQNDHKSLRVGLCSEKGIITSAYVTLRQRSGNLYDSFFYYLIHSFDVSKGFYGIGSGVRQGLNYNGIKNILLPLPPLSEQEAIARYLDDRCKMLDALISLKRLKVEALGRYKKSLIYEVVTGRRRCAP